MEPGCAFGYTKSQLIELLGERESAFADWMRGQTVALCDGKVYDHDKREYVKGCDEAHGLVVYAHDVRQFLAGGPPLD
jgi:hypothetical protein